MSCFQADWPLGSASFLKTVSTERSKDSKYFPNIPSIGVDVKVHLGNKDVKLQLLC